jgi:hypothetical protein
MWSRALSAHNFPSTYGMTNKVWIVEHVYEDVDGVSMSGLRQTTPGQ